MLPVLLLIFVVLKSDGLDKEENPPGLVSGSENRNENQDQSSKPMTAEPKTGK